MWRAVGDIGSRERLWLATGGSKRGQRVREGVIGVPKARYLHRYDSISPLGVEPTRPTSGWSLQGSTRDRGIGTGKVAGAG